jgi:hypothetical protein
MDDGTEILCLGWLSYFRSLKIENVQCKIKANQVPDRLLPVERDFISSDDDFQSYIEEVNEFAQQSNDNCSIYLRDIPAKARYHCDVDCVAGTEYFKVLVGVNFEEFGALLDHLEMPFSEAFPHSTFNQKGMFLTIRMRLFLYLFRLKNASSFRLMEALFGWGKSTLLDNHSMLNELVYSNLHNLHDGFLNHLGKGNRAIIAALWSQKIQAKFQSFQNRLQITRIQYPDLDLPHENTFIGSIGAVDCTYSNRPRIISFYTEEYGESLSADRMYSEYAGAHAYKIGLICSHQLKSIFQDAMPKVILKVDVTAGRASDAATFGKLYQQIRNDLHGDVSLLGDHAFQGHDKCITPYTVNHIHQFPNHVSEMNTYNTDHSSERMPSEHGVHILKSWGIVRGRDDIRLFENELEFEKTVKSVQAIHNFVSLLKQ